jgi:hypothetical protein
MPIIANMLEVIGTMDIITTVIAFAGVKDLTAYGITV